MNRFKCITYRSVYIGKQCPEECQLGQLNLTEIFTRKICLCIFIFTSRIFCACQIVIQEIADINYYHNFQPDLEKKFFLKICFQEHRNIFRTIEEAFLHNLPPHLCQRVLITVIQVSVVYKQLLDNDSLRHSRDRVSGIAVFLNY